MSLYTPLQIQKIHHRGGSISKTATKHTAIKQLLGGCFVMPYIFAPVAQTSGSIFRRGG